MSLCMQGHIKHKLRATLAPSTICRPSWPGRVQAIMPRRPTARLSILACLPAGEAPAMMKPWPACAPSLAHPTWCSLLLLVLCSVSGMLSGSHLTGLDL